VDIRLAMIILAGSLFGIQLGAIGTTYVKPYMVKVVMGTIMLIVLFARAVVIPVYLAELELIAPLSEDAVAFLEGASFVLTVGGLVTGGVIVLRALLRGIRQHRAELALAAAASMVATVRAARAPVQLSPAGRLDRILLATDGSEFSAGATHVAIAMARQCNAELTSMSMVLIGEIDGVSGENLARAEEEAQRVLDDVQAEAHAQNYGTRVEIRRGMQPYKEIVRLADELRTDVIVMGRRGRRGLALRMVGEATRNTIGFADCSVLVVPRLARLWEKRILVATDGSRYADLAAVFAGRLGKTGELPVSVVSIVRPQADEPELAEGRQAVERIRTALAHDGVETEGALLEGESASGIIAAARERGADLIVVGSHGRTGLGRLLLGSVSEGVIGQAECPVLVVKG